MRLGLVCLLFMAPLGMQTGGAHAATLHFESEGVHGKIAIDTAQGNLQSGTQASLSLRFTHAGTDTAAATSTPRVWWQMRRNETVASEWSCADKYRALTSGSLAARAEIDAAGFTLATLNSDATITFIDPQLAWNRTKLESVVVLPGRPLDWAEDARGTRWLVTLPAADAVAIVDARTRKLLGTRSLGSGAHPTRVVALPGGGFAVAEDGSGTLALLDENGELRTRVSVGAGPHALRATGLDGPLAVSAAQAGRVTLVHLHGDAPARQIELGDTPLALAWSPLRKLVYVGRMNGGAVTAIDPTSGEAVATLTTPGNAAALAVDPSGRFLFAADTRNQRVHVFDLSNHAHLASAVAPEGPDQFAFTRQFAYVRAAGAQEIALVDLAEIARLAERAPGAAPVQLSALRIPMSRATAASEPATLGVAGMLAPAPEGNAMLLASNADRMLYYYVEGLMAPMGTLNNYRRAPLGVRVIDRSLRRSGEGRFDTQLQLPAPGNYDVVVALDNPKLTHCLTLRVLPDPAAPHDKPDGKLAVHMDAPTPVRADTDVRLRFTLEGRPARIDAAPVRLLAFRPPGSWQLRETAHLRADGSWEVALRFPSAGRYRLVLGGGPFGEGYERSPVLELEVAAAHGANAAVREAHR